MPPQVRGAGPGKGPVVVHSQDGVNETKSGNTQNKPSENHQNTSVPHRATSKEKSQKTLEQLLEVTSLLNKLGEAISDVLKKPEESSTEAKTTKGGKSGWLGDLAQVLGEMENKQAEKVTEKATKPMKSEADMADLKAESQVHSIMSDAVNTAVKAISEAVSTAARKQ